jgi:S1-C subfamily serine protease
VDPMSPASGNVPRGFRIERLNGRDVSSAADLRTAVSGLRPGDTVSLIGKTPDGRPTIVNFTLND